METTMNIKRDGLQLPLGGGRRPPHAMRPDALPRSLFVGELIARGLPHVACDSFRGASTPEKLAELTTPVLVQSDPDADEVEAFVRLPGGEIALVDTGHSHVRVEVAAATSDAAHGGLRVLQRALELERPAPERISVDFWMRGEFGGEVRHREIDAPSFDEIAGNYSAQVRGALECLIDFRCPERGRLVLWRGEPGTGKSHALRAPARSWSPWCSAHFIMDPDEFLGHGGAYLLDVVTWGGGTEERWRLLILEDAGELIAADARAVGGRALQRLLNVADGLLGQGTRTLLLVTTNEPVKGLTRPRAIPAVAWPTSSSRRCRQRKRTRGWPSTVTTAASIGLPPWRNSSASQSPVRSRPRPRRRLSGFPALWPTSAGGRRGLIDDAAVAHPYLDARTAVDEHHGLHR